ncbi:MAG: ParB/RepB/Spo0J family partition protein [Minisyncoccia bacterium]
MTAEYEFHPLANLFPLMRGHQYSELVHDIRVNGLLEPVILLGGQILDGRNRYRACREAAVECKFKEFDGKDPMEFVVSANLRRRHLSTSERASFAAKLSNFKVGSNQHSEGLPIGRAADLFNVSPRSVARAKASLNGKTPQSGMGNFLAKLRIDGGTEAQEHLKQIADIGVSSLRQMDKLVATAIWRVRDVPRDQRDAIVSAYVAEIKTVPIRIRQYLADLSSASKQKASDSKASDARRRHSRPVTVKRRHKKKAARRAA